MLKMFKLVSKHAPLFTSGLFTKRLAPNPEPSLAPVYPARSFCELLLERGWVLPSRFYSTKAVPPPDSRVAHRLPPPCLSCEPPPCKAPCDGPGFKPCFDINSVVVERTNPRYAPMVKSFLETYYFTREPSIVGLFIPLDSYYLAYLTKYFMYDCKGWLAFKVVSRTGEKKLIGMLVGNKKYPWEASKFERWADLCCDPERIHMYFHAHCFRHPDIFNKYKVPFVYDIAMVATASEYIGMGVADLLLQSALLYSVEMRFPLVQLIATNSYMNKVCERANMVKAWTMKYLDYIDRNGKSVFHPRYPHTEVNIYVRTLQPSDRFNSPGLSKLMNRLGKGDGYCKRKKPGIDLFPPLPKCPTLNRYK